MKIIIPVNSDKKTVCIVFGRTPLFAINDTETKQVTYLPNPAVDAQGGAGIKAAQFVIDSGADAIVTVRLGENSAEVFKAANIKIYKNTGDNVEDNFALCQDGKLSPLTSFHSGYHGRL